MLDHNTISLSLSLSPRPERPCPAAARPLPYCLTPLLLKLLLSVLLVTLVEANCVVVRAQPELTFF